MKLLYREDFREARCNTPGCREDHDLGQGGLFIHARCHPGGGLTVEATDVGAALTIRCLLCGAVAAKVAVARAPAQNQ